MRYDDRISNEYFEWLYDVVNGNVCSKYLSFRRLLEHLHDTEFIFFIRNDENRAKDGVSLRYRFALSHGFDDTPECLDGPCSVLEMMIALALRCEEDTMDDPKIGDRTGQWFWGMITNLGLGAMYDIRFDFCYTEDVVMRFLNREYESDGRGGLFTIRNPRYDLRDVEIWQQLNDYLNCIV